MCTVGSYLNKEIPHVVRVRTRVPWGTYFDKEIPYVVRVGTWVPWVTGVVRKHFGSKN